MHITFPPNAHVRVAKADILKESLAETLYDFVRVKEFAPFSIVFANGQRYEIKTRDHIGHGPREPLGPRRTEDADTLG